MWGIVHLPMQAKIAKKLESFNHRGTKMFLLTDKLRVSKLEFIRICYEGFECYEWMKKTTKSTKTDPIKKCNQLIHLRAKIDALANSTWIYLRAYVQAQMRSLYRENSNNCIKILCLDIMSLLLTLYEHLPIRLWLIHFPVTLHMWRFHHFYGNIVSCLNLTSIRSLQKLNFQSIITCVLTELVNLQPKKGSTSSKLLSRT